MCKWAKIGTGCTILKGRHLSATVIGTEGLWDWWISDGLKKLAEGKASHQHIAQNLAATALVEKDDR